jgi:uncharacterized protein DUF222
MERSSRAAVWAADSANSRVATAQCDLLFAIVAVDETAAWREDGARNTAHWVSMRYGVSEWKAHRWLAAGKALRGLPRLTDALASGELSLDKVVELTRFATPEREGDLIRWAQGVLCSTVRRRADVEVAARREAVVEANGSAT